MLVQLTVGQLTEIVKTAVSSALQEAQMAASGWEKASCEEVCRLLGVTNQSLKKMLNDGKLDGIVKRINYRAYLVNMNAR